MLLVAVLVAAGCREAQVPPTRDSGQMGIPSPAAAPLALEVRSIPLPGAPAEGVFMDYLAYDPAHRRVWVPAGNTGSVMVIETTTNAVTRIDGFRTVTVERNGKRRTVGPSSATVGNGAVYVGNRGDASVCAIDAESLRLGACVPLDSMPDALVYVTSTKEVWATTPRDHSIVVLDAANADRLTRKATIHLDGQPEGFAIDEGRGVFYSNLEDADSTLAIDVANHRMHSRWPAGCGPGGPKGLALDRERNLLMVACTDRVMVLDAGHAGKRLATLAVGDGVDNIDYREPRRELYAAAARAARLTVARLDQDGSLTPVAVVRTPPGARNPVVSDDGTAYLTDSAEGNVVMVAPVTAH